MAAPIDIYSINRKELGVFAVRISSAPAKFRIDIKRGHAVLSSRVVDFCPSIKEMQDEIDNFLSPPPKPISRTPAGTTLHTKWYKRIIRG